MGCHSAVLQAVFLTFTFFIRNRDIKCLDPRKERRKEFEKLYNRLRLANEAVIIINPSGLSHAYPTMKCHE